MGLKIGEIVQRKEIKFEELKGKIIAIDAFNTLYQFLSTIRQPDGTPLMDSKGNITSYLSGLFYRTVSLLSFGIKPVFVFDGTPPKEKGATKEKREQRKKDAKAMYIEAKKSHDEEEMAKYAKRFPFLDEKMIKESKQLISALGLTSVQAPGEGEAQAAFMAKQKEVYASASQDYDSLLFSCPLLIQNLTLSRKRKLASGAFVEIRPEMIELQEVLKSLQINQEQLICLGILIGTDYNPPGVRGIGPKTALKIVKQYKKKEKIFKSIEKEKLDFEWQKIFELFKNPDVTNKYDIKFSNINEKDIKKILCKKHEFSQERIDNALKKLEEARKNLSQEGLQKWF